MSVITSLSYILFTQSLIIQAFCPEWISFHFIVDQEFCVTAEPGLYQESVDYCIGIYTEPFVPQTSNVSTMLALMNNASIPNLFLPIHHLTCPRSDTKRNCTQLEPWSGEFVEWNGAKPNSIAIKNLVEQQYPYLSNFNEVPIISKNRQHFLLHGDGSVTAVDGFTTDDGLQSESRVICSQRIDNDTTADKQQLANSGSERINLINMPVMGTALTVTTLAVYQSWVLH